MSRPAKKETCKFWQDTMEEYEKSGLKIKEFCKQNNLSFNKFRNWRFRIKKKQNVNDKKVAFDNKFIPLAIKDIPVVKDLIPIHTIELKFEPSGNINICIPSQFNSESVSKLLAILRRTKC